MTEHSLSHLTPEDVVSEVSNVSSFAISRDGTKVAFIWKKPEGAKLFVSGLDGFNPVALADAPGFITWPSWSPKGGLIAFQKDNEGRECYNLFTVNPTTGALLQLTDFEKNDRIRGYSWSPDGEYIAFDSNSQGSFDIYLIRRDGTGLEKLTSGDEQYFSPDWFSDGNHLRFSSVKVFGAGIRPELMAIRKDGSGLKPVGCSPGSWSPDESRIVFSNPDESGFFNLNLLETGTGETRTLTSEGCEVWGAFWSPDGRSVACTVDKEGNWLLGLVDPETGELRTVGPSGGKCTCSEFTPDGKSLLFVHESSRNPKDLWRLNLSSGEMQQLTNGCTESIDRDLLISPEVILYSSFDDLQIPAFLFKPKDQGGKSPPPAVIWVHGGPNYQFTNVWSPTIQLLASHGYVVMVPNYRGSTGYGMEFACLNKGDLGGGDMKDIVAAADYLESEGLADGKRIALYGGSYGGFLINLALAEAPERWAAAVNLFGFVDLVSFHENTRGWMREYYENLIGSPESNPEFYHDRSPINRAEKITTPLLYFHGANDPRVPISESEKLIEVLRSQGNECIHVVYEDEGHGFQKKSNQIDMMRKSLEFLEKHLWKIH